MNPNSAAILGALVADAASLGLHWLYDTKRIAQIRSTQGLTFLAPDAANYAETKGYFAHGDKMAGDSSGYGETCLLMLNHLATHGDFQRVEYQTEYRQYFGPGGTYIGYIDTPTRLTLLKLLPLSPADFPAESGADDDQHPTLAALPALVAKYSGNQESMLLKVEEVVRVTNNNALAVSAAQCAAIALAQVLNGTTMAEALTAALPYSGKTLRPLLEQALDEPALNSVAVAERFGLACHVAQGLPVIFHIVCHAPDFQSAIEANILAGGDSCGRSIMLGALVAAYQAKQGNAAAIPLTWLARYNKLTQAADACLVFNA